MIIGIGYGIIRWKRKLKKQQQKNKTEIELTELMMFIQNASCQVVIVWQHNCFSDSISFVLKIWYVHSKGVH